MQQVSSSIEVLTERGCIIVERFQRRDLIGFRECYPREYYWKGFQCQSSLVHPLDQEMFD